MTADRVVFAPAAGGSAGFAIALLLLLLLLGLAGGGEGSSGEPVSPWADCQIGALPQLNLKV